MTVRRSLRIWRFIRDADWLHPSRARAYLAILATIQAITLVGYLATAHHGLDFAGRPLGTDFASFWTASKLALAGHTIEVWNPSAHYAAQQELFGHDVVYAAFFYPPPYLLACLPLALAPYTPSLVLWLGATGFAWWAVTRAWLGGHHHAQLILGFPAVLLNLGHGQNGFLTAALLGGAVLMSEKRPWTAGLLIGALVIKPHLAVLAPLFLLLSGNWRAILAAMICACGLCAVSLFVFGAEAWSGFLVNSSLARQALENDLVGYAKMQSAFAAARLLGAPLGVAWSLQTMSALLGIIGLFMVRRVMCGPALGAAMICATLLTTPFLLDYDFTVLAMPLAWLYGQARRTAFWPWEKLVLFAGFVLPLAARPLATLLHLPIAPLTLLALLACISRRAAERPPTVNQSLAVEERT